MIDPWNEALYQQLAERQERLPHALLIGGLRGVGKRNFAFALARFLLCQAQQGTVACGHCRSCILFDSADHPDFIVVEPVVEEAKQDPMIKIEQLRALGSQLHIHTNQEGKRVVVIVPAERMTFSGANSLLKMLEEPPIGSYFFLITSHFDRILPTIRSRCQPIDVAVPPYPLALEWLGCQVPKKHAEIYLSLASGSPYEAKEFFSQYGEGLSKFITDITNLDRKDPLEVVKSLHENEYSVLAGCLQKWLHDVIVVRLGGHPRFFPHQTKALAAVARDCQISALFSYQDFFLRYIQRQNHPLNKQTNFEDLLIQWSHVAHANA